MTSTDIYTPARARYGQRHLGVLWTEQEAPILCSLPGSCLVKSVKDWYHGSGKPMTRAWSLTFPPVKLWSNLLFTEMWNAFTVPECTLKKKKKTNLGTLSSLFLCNVLMNFTGLYSVSSFEWYIRAMILINWLA